MNNNPGSDVASFRILTVALVRDAIFGKDEQATRSLSGRKNKRVFKPDKLNYIRSLNVAISTHDFSFV